MLSGWVTADSGKVYYFDSNYAMQTGWQNIGGEKYYFASGAGVSARIPGHFRRTVLL